MNETVVDFKRDFKNFPEFVTKNFLGLVHAWLTQVDDLALLSGSVFIMGRNRKLKGFGLYLLLWLFYRDLNGKFARTLSTVAKIAIDKRSNEIS